MPHSIAIAGDRGGPGTATAWNSDLCSADPVTGDINERIIIGIDGGYSA
jgi:hypothetical protein